MSENLLTDHSELLKESKTFKFVLEVDEKSFRCSSKAFNQDSILSLLAIATAVNKPRVSGWVLFDEMDRVLASTPSEKFINQMTKQTSLISKAPESVPESPKIFKETRIGKNIDMSDESKRFVLEAIIDGIVDTKPVSGPDKESVIALLTIATCDKMPRISGWNLYDENGKLLVSVPAIGFLAEVAKETPLGIKPADPKMGGWRVSNVVTPTTEQFQQMLAQAKKEGRTPQ